jgi:hypothetical protein
MPGMTAYLNGSYAGAWERSNKRLVWIGAACRIQAHGVFRKHAPWIYPFLFMNIRVLIG